MFFPERIKSIAPSDRVLEIGPGGQPFPRSDAFLEMNFDSAETAHAQRGLAPAADLGGRKLHYYDGGRFPFEDREFDYVICSHVIEHVSDPVQFVAEINRVGRKGYFEFPVLIYDFIYDIPEHLNYVGYRDGTLRWMRKIPSFQQDFSTVHRFFNQTLKLGYQTLLEDLREYFFQGFEWSGSIRCEKSASLEDLLPAWDLSAVPPSTETARKRRLAELESHVGRLGREVDALQIELEKLRKRDPLFQARRVARKFKSLLQVAR